MPFRTTPLKSALAIGVVSALLALTGCDRVATGELQVGQSTVADMKVKMGEPASVVREGDREVWEYPLGPEGVKTYRMTVNSQGVLERIDQILTEENFKRIVPGMTMDEVRKIIGKPGKDKRYALSYNEVTYVWKFNRANADMFFEVLIDGNGRVKSTGFDDPALSRGSSK
jgi:hypothetical protein